MNWNPGDHPRNPADGEFVESGGTWLERIAEAAARTPAARRAWPDDFAKQIRERHPGIKLDMHRAVSGHIVLSRIVTAERSKGVGTEVMQAMTEVADKMGDTIALTPSADFGGSKPRLEKFYRRFGFVPNKGRTRDSAISETMVRVPR